MSTEGEDQVTQQDANTQESSAPEQQAADSSEQSPAQETQEQGTDRSTPFHEHPRFKELIDYKNQSEQRLQQYEEKLQQMASQYEQAMKAQRAQAEAPKMHPFVNRLREIDPMYGEWAQTLEQKAAVVEQLKAELDNMRNERLRSDYESGVSKLHAASKLPEKLQPFVKKELDNLIYQNKLTRLEDLPKAYKEVADEYSKLLEQEKRADRAQLVQEKSKDAKIPTSAKGKTPPKSQSSEYTGDREADMATIARRVLKISRAGNEI